MLLEERTQGLKNRYQGLNGEEYQKFIRNLMCQYGNEFSNAWLFIPFKGRDQVR